MVISRSFLTKTISWSLLIACIFSLFFWLFNLGMPGAAFQFALGSTIIISSGLIGGTYAARLWKRSNNKNINKVLAVLVTLLLLSLLLIGFFINKMIAHTQFDYFFFAVICLFILNGCIAAIIRLVRTRIKNNIQATQTALFQSKADLQILQSQLSPHFLFNTLNNLYGLSLEEPAKLPDLLLKLAALLRYSVYEVREPFVPLGEELNYLQNYIEFEKIRLSDRLHLKVLFPNSANADITIAPMLLIVFVENAFKHSKNNQDEQIFIEMELRADKKSIFFSITNSCTNAETSSAINPHSGFGLDSVRKRLNLLYAGRHELTITPAQNSYSVQLILTLS